MRTLLVLLIVGWSGLLAYSYIVVKPEIEKVQAVNNEKTEYLEELVVLKDSVEDLQIKARILNTYLNYKHLEYIDVCNLVQRKKE